MNLSEAIQSFSRRNLNTVSTVVTRSDGRKYVEGNGKVEERPYLPNDPTLVLGTFYVIDNSPDENIYEVIPCVFIGSQDGASNKQALIEANVTHILNVAVGIQDHYPEDFVYLDQPVYDIPEFDVISCFNECCTFLCKALNSGGSVLVHCNAGVSRSATVIIAYLMKYHGKNYNDAYNIVKQARPAIRPNDGFIKQLKEYEKMLSK